MKAVPKLRFKEFNEKWRESNLDSGISLISGQHLSPGEYNTDGKGVPYFTGPSDFTSELSKVSKWSIDSSNFGERGDILITVKGSGVGTMTLQRLDKVAIGRQLMAIKSGSFDSEFIYHFLLTKSKYFFALASGNMIPGLARPDILSLKFYSPTLPEQQKIASFLSAVDEKKQQLTRKKELLEQYKKGVMQQLFSGKLRFKDENGKPYAKWEEKRLGDVGEFRGGGTPSTNVEKYWKGDIPWISSSDIIEDDIQNIKINRYINQNAINDSATKLIPRGSIMLVSRVGVGKLAISKVDLCTSQDFANFISRDCNSYYLGYLLIARKNFLFNIAQGTSIKGFTIDDAKALKIPVPHLEEQQKIASFLTALDAKIESVAVQIAHTQTFKKGLLQQMFI